MKTDGYNFTKTQIKDKWTNMRKQYIRIKDNNKQTGAERKTYRYYNEMDELYGNKPNINPVATASNMRKSIEDENILSSSEDSTITTINILEKGVRSNVNYLRGQKNLLNMLRNGRINVSSVMLRE